MKNKEMNKLTNDELENKLSKLKKDVGSPGTELEFAL